MCNAGICSVKIWMSDKLELEEDLKKGDMVVNSELVTSCGGVEGEEGRSDGRKEANCSSPAGGNDYGKNDDLYYTSY
ncbi:hypothetical protein llap_1900 [Limosa lapponica baueri]|uniref:Uncharacterized protein n=1 Tax=Limosa lapponica baueri TaxID=1758121 RepID=A0A2I0UP45_LIMLA|nr:hypothetical protein llap_1900 [Limosa lapponica baueri]